MHKKIIIANWKMNPDAPGRAIRLAKEIERGIRRVKNVEVVIAPPHLFLSAAGGVLRIAKLGAQNMHWANVGPYTGEVSWHQLKHYKVKYVIIGHSERRIHLRETDEMINKKLKAALKSGLIPILAVGEQKRVSDNKMRVFLARQLTKNLAGISVNAFQKAVVAYEPVWAIGAGGAATAKHARVALNIIRETLAKRWNAKNISVPIIYGGSVNSQNAASFVSKSGGAMGGLLVGSASLRAKEFLKIVRNATAAI